MVDRPPSPPTEFASARHAPITSPSVTPPGARSTSSCATQRRRRRRHRRRGRRALRAAPQRRPPPPRQARRRRLPRGRASAAATAPRRRPAVEALPRRRARRQPSTFPSRHDDLLATLLGEALAALAGRRRPSAWPRRSASSTARHGGAHGPDRGPPFGAAPRSHAVADALTAHGFAAHAEKRGDALRIVVRALPVRRRRHRAPDVICAVDRGMVKGMLAGLYGETRRTSSRAGPTATTTASPASEPELAVGARLPRPRVVVAAAAGRARRDARRTSREHHARPRPDPRRGPRRPGSRSRTRASRSPRCFGARPREVVFTATRHRGGRTAVLGRARRGASGGARTSSRPRSSTRRCSTRADRDATPRSPSSASTAPAASTPTSSLAAIRPDTALVHVQLAQPRGRHAARPRGRDRARPRASAACSCTSTRARPPATLRSTSRARRRPLSVTAHKFGGPKGAGALLVRRGLRLAPLLVGGAQERARRGGLENVPAIVGFGAAVPLARRRLAARGRRAASADRDRVRRSLDAVPDVERFGDPAASASPTSCASASTASRPSRPARARPARRRRALGIVVLVASRSSRHRCSRRWASTPTARCGSRWAGRARWPTSSGSSRCSRESSSDSGGYEPHDCRPPPEPCRSLRA